MFKNMKLGTKIAAGFSMLVALALILGGLAVFNMKNVQTESDVLAHEYVPEVSICNDIERNSLMTMYNMRGYAFTEEEKYLKEGQTYLEEVNKYLGEAQELADKATRLVKLGPAVKEAKELVAEYTRLSEQTVELNGKLAEDRVELNTYAEQYMKNCSEFLAGQNQHMIEEIEKEANTTTLEERLEKITIVNDIIDLGNEVRLATWKSQAERNPAIIREAIPIFEQIDQKFESLREITRLESDIKRIDDTEYAAEHYKNAMTDLLNNWVESQKVSDQRTRVADQVLASAKSTSEAGMEGCEHIAVEAASSLSAASLTMIIGLSIALILGIVLAWFIVRSITNPINRIIGALTDGAEQVSMASEQVAGASQSLAEGASEQASALEETSSSLEEMAGMTRQNADNANQANGLSGEASSSADKGMRAMDGMSKAMQDIKKSSDETAKIIKVIDEIAFQTNLLALNAAVEAARAGDAGKGFAVVAEEVRNLAQRSAEAAKDTSALIEGSQKNADDGVKATEELVEILKDITGASKKVNDLLGEVSAASQEQSQGIDQLNNAMAQMDQVTQQNSANAEESSSAAEELAAQAQELSNVVNDLTCLVHGQGSGKTAAQTMHKIHENDKPKSKTSNDFKQKSKRQFKSYQPQKPAKKESIAVRSDEVIPLEEAETAGF